MVNKWLNFDIICKMITAFIVFATALGSLKTEGLQFVGIALIYCVVFLPTRKFDKTISKYNNYLLILEYWLLFSGIVFFSQVLLSNQLISSIIFIVILFFSLLCSYLLSQKYRSNRSSKYLNDFLDTRWFQYTVAIAIITVVFFFINITWFNGLTISLLCAQYYFYLSYNKRTILLKR